MLLVVRRGGDRKLIGTGSAGWRGCVTRAGEPRNGARAGRVADECGLGGSLDLSCHRDLATASAPPCGGPWGAVDRSCPRAGMELAFGVAGVTLVVPSRSVAGTRLRRRPNAQWGPCLKDRAARVAAPHPRIGMADSGGRWAAASSRVAGFAASEESAGAVPRGSAYGRGRPPHPRIGMAGSGAREGRGKSSCRIRRFEEPGAAGQSTPFVERSRCRVYSVKGHASP